jgi:hypothetical protein
MNKTKYELHITGECKQNLKLCKKRGLPMQELCHVIDDFACLDLQH